MRPYEKGGTTARSLARTRDDSSFPFVFVFVYRPSLITMEQRLCE